MSSDANGNALTPEEAYTVAVSWGTIVGTWALMLVICGARLYTRKFILKSFCLDDWASLVAVITTTVFSGLSVGVIYVGLGRHAYNVSQKNLRIYFILYYVITSTFLIFSFFVKLSLLLFMKRLFPTTYVQRVSTGIIVFLALFTVSGCFLDAFLCNPPKYIYDLDFATAADRSRYCFPNSVTYGAYMYQAALLFTTDIMILLLPVPAILKLNMSRGRVSALVIIFGSASVACIAPILRFQTLNFLRTSGNTDATYTSASSLYWMNIEYNLGLVAGSIACLRPFLAAIGIIRSGPSEKALAAGPWKNSSGGGVDGLGRNDARPKSGPHELTTIGGGPKWRRFGGHRAGASSRVQGESVLHTQLERTTVAPGPSGQTDSDNESQGDPRGDGSGVLWQGQHGSTDRIVHTEERQVGYKV